MCSSTTKVARATRWWSSVSAILALSAQARETVADIDAALERMAKGAYGYSVESGRPISRERLEAIPWATVLVEEKVGGIGRR